MARGFSIWVNIGAAVSSSVNAAARQVEGRMSAMGRSFRVMAAEQKAMQRQMAAGYKDMALMMAGAGSAKGLATFIKAGAEYQHQVSMLKTAGMSQAEVTQAIAAANKTLGDVPTSTLAENLKIINETRLAYGGLAHAIDNLTFNQKMGAMMKNIMGEGYDTVEGFNQLVRALELRSGKMGSADYQRQASALFKAMAVSGGTVNPENILAFAQTAALPMRGYSEDYLTRVVPSLIQEFGGDRAGTVATAFFNQLMGRVGVGGKAVTNEWIRLGLVPRNGTGGNLSKTGWTPESLRGYGLAMSNPLQWMEQVMFPALKAHGVDTQNPEKMRVEAFKLFGRVTGARFANTLMDPAQLARIHADMGLYDKALGPDAAFTQAMANDPQMAMASAAASLKNLETSIGRALSPDVIKFMNGFAKGVNRIAGALDKHPRLAKGIGYLAAGIAGLAAIGLGKAIFDFLRLGSIISFFVKGPGRLLDGFFGLFLRTNVIGGIVARGRVSAIGGALLRLGPMILEGLGAAFALLSNPIGWTVLVVAGVGLAAALVWHFRGAIAKAWREHVVPWFGTAFEWIKAKIISLPWASVGMAIADALTFGMASRLAHLPAAIRNAFPAMGGGGKQAGASSAESDAMAALQRGDWGAVGRDAAALRDAGRLGAANALVEALKATHPGLKAANGNNPIPANVNINIYESKDAAATAAAVQKALKRLAADQAAMLSD